MPDQFLYCLSGDERAYTDPAECYESCLEPFAEDDTTTVPGRAHVIEEWTARPAGSYLPDPKNIAERVAEWAADEMGVDDAWDDHWGKACKDPEVIAAYRAAGELLASKVSWLMCGEKVGELTVTWTADGSPLLDGEPMYVRREDTDA